jgi:hypothetical protein
MKKKIILLTIILIPSLIYFFFELSEVNFKKMAYYGPKKVAQNGDTLYYSLPDNALDFGTFYKSATDSLGELVNKLPKTNNSFLIILYVCLNVHMVSNDFSMIVSFYSLRFG